MSKGPQFSEGRYWVKAVSQAFGQSKNKKTPEFSLRFLILGKVDPANPEGDLLSCEQLERTLYMYITDGTAEFVIEDLELLGYDRPSFRFLDPNVPQFHDFSGKEFEAFCEHEEYQGQERERWRVSKRRPPREVPPLDDKDVRKLDSLYGKQLAKLSKSSAPEKKNGGGELVGVSSEQRTASGVGRADPTAPPTVDEIPF